MHCYANTQYQVDFNHSKHTNLISSVLTECVPSFMVVDWVLGQPSPSIHSNNMANTVCHIHIRIKYQIEFDRVKHVNLFSIVKVR